MQTEEHRPDMLLERMTTLLGERLGLLAEEITPQARFKEDLGMDSLDMVELLTIVEEESGIALDAPDESFRSMSTVGGVIDFLVTSGTGAESGEGVAAWPGRA